VLRAYAPDEGGQHLRAFEVAARLGQEGLRFALVGLGHALAVQGVL